MMNQRYRCKMHVLMEHKNKIIVSFAVVILTCILCWGLYLNVIRDTAGHQEYYIKAGNNGQTITIREGETFVQDVLMVEGNIHGISLAFDKKGNLEGYLNVQLFFPDTNAVIYEWNFDLQDINIEEEYTNLFANEEIVLEKGETYQLHIKPYETGKEGISLYKCTDESITYHVFGRIMGPNKKVFGAFILGIGCLVASIVTVLFVKQKLEKTFIFIALIVGIIYMFAIPPYMVPDEETHFVTVYAKSSELLGEKSVDEKGHIIARGEDFNYFRRNTHPNRNTYAYYMKGLLGVSNTGIHQEEISLLRSPVEISGTVYIPQIVGVSLARILNFNGVQLLYMGRFCALLFYIVAIYLAIKYMPFAKMVILGVAMLPMSMQQAASFSYDATLNSLALLMISYFLHLIYEKEKVTKRDIIILGICTALMIPIKGVYITILGMGILIPSEKFGGNLKKYISAALLMLIGVGGTIVTRISTMPGFGTEATEQIFTDYYTFRDILETPIATVNIFLRTIGQRFSYYLETMIGSQLGWLEIQIPFIVIFSFVLILMISTLNTEEKNTIIVTRKEKRWLFVLCMITLLGVCLGMFLSFTIQGSLFIEGVQGRYFLPILPMCLLLLRNQVIVLKHNIDSYLISGILFGHIITIISVIGVVMGRV